MEPEDYKDIPLNLMILAEECSEVIRIISKIMRFGLKDYHPKNKFVNQEALIEEVGHVFTMVNILIANKVLDRDKISHHSLEKLSNMAEWYRKPAYLSDPSVTRENL